MSVQYSSLWHQCTCGVMPIGGRTVIRTARAEAKVGSLHVPEKYQGVHQADWEAEVVATADTGGWRMGDLKPAALEQYGHLLERPPEQLSKAERNNAKIWNIAPYYVEKPVVPPGSKVLCCWLSGQPFLSTNGFDYYLTDGEHAYKAVINQS